MSAIDWERHVIHRGQGPLLQCGQISEGGMQGKRQAHGANLRKGRSSEIGRAYLLTFVLHARRPLFANFKLGRVLVNQFRASDSAGLSQTLAFVVMPDHCHWLIVLKKRTLSVVAGRVKARSAKSVHALTGESGALWQPGFHDHALRQEEDIPAIARYIVANPLRAGLVNLVGEYPLWDAIWLTDSPS